MGTGFYFLAADFHGVVRVTAGCGFALSSQGTNRERAGRGVTQATRLFNENFHSTNVKARRVAPCTPSSKLETGARGATRPTSHRWFRGSRTEL